MSSRPNCSGATACADPATKATWQRWQYQECCQRNLAVPALAGLTPARQVVFAPDGTVTPFDIGVMLAEYL